MKNLSIEVTAYLTSDEFAVKEMPAGSWIVKIEGPNCSELNIAGSAARLVALADAIYESIKPTCPVSQGEALVDITDAELMANGIDTNAG